MFVLYSWWESKPNVASLRAPSLAALEGEKKMDAKTLCVAGLAAIAALGTIACHGGPTSPKPPDTFKLVATITNDSGAANMIDAEASIDAAVVSSSCQADALGNCQNDPVATFNFSGIGNIGPGAHTIEFIVYQSTTSRPVTYTISGCTLQVFDENGKLLRNFTFPPLTQTVNFGAEMYYSFTL
jgi:hypothetical protein